MAWSSLSSRLSSLPLLLAGPIVRRAEVTNVSIWFVLKENRPVTVKIFDTDQEGVTFSPIFTENQSKGVQIGDHIFVYCVTVSTVSEIHPFSLVTSENYFYDIDFGQGESLSGFIAAGLDLTYGDSKRPSFALPPNDINQVRLIHGSCRKPHGEGYDAMEGVDIMIEASVVNGAIDAIQRPHQLFLTGDQIYADDVADVLLFMIDDAANVLFKWDEDYSPFTPADLAPGKRNTGNILNKELGFTGAAKSHLLKFREYAMMYLFVWSDVLWPRNNGLPNFKDVYGREGQADSFDKEKEHIQNFNKTIKIVRKALANIPTYMVFDDHEITDDWNLNWKWCKQVYSKPLGRRTVQNGLLAYALFQAWGNTPDQFKEPVKNNLLFVANLWRGTNENNHFSTIGTLLNIQEIKPKAAISDFPHSSAVHFDWHFEYQSNSYAVYVQDSRTWRSFLRDKGKKSDIDFADLISQKGLTKQLPPTFPKKEVILVVAPCPLIGIPLIEEYQRNPFNIINEITNPAPWLDFTPWDLDKNQPTFQDTVDNDTEHWALNQFGYEKLFRNLASRMPVTGSGFSRQRKGRLAFLSGDVHYGLSARKQIWGTAFFMDNTLPTNTNLVFAQLTASSFKNELSGSKGTIRLHHKGYPTSIAEEIAGEVDFKYEPRALPPKKEVLASPNWKYRIDWILGTNPSELENPFKLDIFPDSRKRKDALDDYLKNAQNAKAYFSKWGPGREIVGFNNVGEIKFNFSSSNKQIDHILWWRMTTSRSEPLKPFPLTKYSIPMNQTGDKNHLNELIKEPGV